MKILTKQSAPRYERDEGIVSHLLASPLTCDAAHLTTSVVEVGPGGHQRIHRHPPEQVYYVLDGSGLMTVGDETERVGPGDCVFIPSDTPHGLRNDGPGNLRYFSAAAPAFPREELARLWPLPSESA